MILVLAWFSFSLTVPVQTTLSKFSSGLVQCQGGLAIRIKLVMCSTELRLEPLRHCDFEVVYELAVEWASQPTGPVISLHLC